MPTGAGLNGLMMALVPLVGIATILKARRNRKRGEPAPLDEAFEKRQAATRETERRMAAYLAQRNSEGYQAGTADSVQEKTR